MPTIEHDELVPEDIHVSYRFIFIDAADREVATGFTESMIGLFALQQDDRSIWQLIQVTPVIKWKKISIDTPLKTLEDMDIYIDPSIGNDVTGDGSATYPYQTITYAYGQVPKRIDHTVRLRPVAGTYTEFPNTIDNIFNRDGILVIESPDIPVDVAGPFTTTNVATIGVSDAAGWTLTVTGAGWTVDEYHGKFVEFTTGNAAGRVFPLYSNSTDSIEIPAQGALTINTGDAFKIIEPSVIVNIDHKITFDLRGTRSTFFSQFYMGNIKIVGGGGGEFYQEFAAFDWRGDILGVLSIVVLQADTGFTVYNQSAGSVNRVVMADLGASLRVPTLGYAQRGSVQILNTDTVPTSPDTAVSLLSTAGIGETTICNFCYRNGVRAQDRSYIEYSIMQHVEIDYNSFLWMLHSRVIGASWGVSAAIIIDDSSFANLEYNWIDSSAGDAIDIEVNSSVVSESNGGTTSNIVGYGFRVGELCRLIIKTGTGIIGTTGQGYFSFTSTPVTYPVSGNSVNDTHGAYILVS